MDARNATFMFYGFAAAWVLVVVYLIALAARERRLRSEMDRLRRMIEDRPRG